MQGKHNGNWHFAEAFFARMERSIVMLEVISTVTRSENLRGKWHGFAVDNQGYCESSKYMGMEVAMYLY
jgi:hypothetical protein